MCDERERLIGYVYDECDESERRLIDSHLAGCGECRDEIRGLRGVREDLLAWDVPDHGSVWQPFVPAVAAPWYRQVPAWAMAAAASLMFVAGGLGGALTHSVLAARTQTVVADAAPVRPVPASISPADLSASEERVISILRAEFGERLDALARQNGRTMRVSAPASGITAEQLRAAENTDDPLMPIVLELYRDMNRLRPTQPTRASEYRSSPVNFGTGPAGR
ncbi:MAG TPA: zf-HC2 domain-containing protein [Vicinamibacterales bacterium]|nr:zf-HC2 domain-containing protein [Vicinamibacterales bacterium]